MSAGVRERCAACGAELPLAAKFCGACGARRGEASPSESPSRHERELEERRTLAALVTLVLGTVASVAAFSQVDAAIPWLAYGAMTATGLVAAWLLPPGSLRASFGGAPRAVDLALALPVGLALFGVGWLWIRAWLALGEAEVPRSLSLGDGLGPALLGLAILPALVEEWLCRGVLWQALRGRARAGATIAATALVFGFLHGPLPIDFVHRALYGVAFGVLRERSGSLVPCVAAHFTLNATAVLFA